MDEIVLILLGTIAMRYQCLSFNVASYCGVLPSLLGQNSVFKLVLIGLQENEFKTCTFKLIIYIHPSTICPFLPPYKRCSLFIYHIRMHAVLPLFNITFIVYYVQICATAWLVKDYTY